MKPDKLLSLTIIAFAIQFIYLHWEVHHLSNRVDAIHEKTLSNEEVLLKWKWGK